MDTHMEKQKRDDVIRFLNTSNEFKRMERIAKADPTNERYTGWVKAIGEAPSLAHILYITGDIDPATTDNTIAYLAGRDRVNNFLYIAGCFSNSCNFMYYLLHLIEDIPRFSSRQKEEQNQSQCYSYLSA